MFSGYLVAMWEVLRVCIHYCQVLQTGTVVYCACSQHTGGIQPTCYILTGDDMQNNHWYLPETEYNASAWHSHLLCCHKTTSLQQSAAQFQTMWAVIWGYWRHFYSDSEATAQCELFLTALTRNVLTYLVILTEHHTDSVPQTDGTEVSYDFQ